MNTRSVLTLLLFCSLIAACGPQWTKPGATSEQLNADFDECKHLATEIYPTELSSTETAERKGYQSDCPSAQHQISCIDKGSSVGGVYQYDQNKEARDEAISRCMEWKGYSR